MKIRTCPNCGADLSPWEGVRCLVHTLKRLEIRHLSNADAALCVAEISPTILNAYDIARIFERDYGRKLYRPSLLVALSSDRRFCWAGKGFYGLYRHRLFPGPRNLHGAGSLFVYAARDSLNLEELAFAMRWCGYRFQDFSLLGAFRRGDLVSVDLTGVDPSDARAWSLSVADVDRMRRYLRMEHFVPRYQHVEPLIERCRFFVKEAKRERRRRLANVGSSGPDEVDQRQAPSCTDDLHFQVARGGYEGHGGRV